MGQIKYRRKSKADRAYYGKLSGSKYGASYFIELDGKLVGTIESYNSGQYVVETLDGDIVQPAAKMVATKAGIARLLSKYGRLSMDDGGPRR